ncbi:MAG: ABC transporter substrate-binding protein [Roseovarius sp.]
MSNRPTSERPTPSRQAPNRPVPAHLLDQALSAKRDPISRREFLAQASSFGASTAAAYAALGLPAPAHADAPDTTQTNRAVVHIQMTVRDLRDPRTYDWFQAANVSRGWLEYLVSYENDGTFRGQLLESWEISDDASRYVLNLRPGVRWNDGSAFTPADVIRNIERWCERDAPGNSMAGRFAVLVDPASGRMRTGAVAETGAHQVTLSLPRPDISLIAGMADYPAAIVPKGFDEATMLEAPIGTGPYLPEVVEPGVRATLVRNETHTWWNAGRGAWMERIEFIDTGTDPSAALAAAQDGEIDMTHTIQDPFIDAFGALDGWDQNEIDTAATIVIRPNQLAEVNGQQPYKDVRVRRALQLAVSNEVVLELGYGNRGAVAENHHIAPLHPEYASLPAPQYDPAAARALMEEAGMADFEHDLISLDDGWRRDTCDAVAALLADAGLKVRRTILPGPDYWTGWASFPYSSTDWGHRPLGVQTYALAYRTGEAWNEFGWSDAAFDTILERALATLDIEARRGLMAQLQTMVQDAGVTVQPYWRRLYNHTRKGLQGGAHHIGFEIRPAELRWT